MERGLRTWILDDSPDTNLDEGMKVPSLIPALISAEAEALAKLFGSSRSEICRRALREFVARHAADPVTRAIDEAVAAVGAESKAFGAEAVRRVVKHVE